MLIFELLGPIIAFFAHLTEQILINQDISEQLRIRLKEQTKRWLTLVLLGLVLLGTVVSIVAITIDEIENSRDKEALQNIAARLEPFLQIAEARFPELRQQEALDRLVEEIDNKFYGFYGAAGAQAGPGSPTRLGYVSESYPAITFVWECPEESGNARFYYFCASNECDHTSYSYSANSEEYTLEVQPGHIYAWKVECDNLDSTTYSPLLKAKYGVPFETLNPDM